MTFFKRPGEAAYHLLPFAIGLRIPFIEFAGRQLSPTSLGCILKSSGELLQQPSKLGNVLAKIQVLGVYEAVSTCILRASKQQRANEDVEVPYLRG